VPVSVSRAIVLFTKKMLVPKWPNWYKNVGAMPSLEKKIAAALLGKPEVKPEAGGFKNEAK